MEYKEAYKNFYKELGESKKMVLSISLNDIVTSRMMSIIVLNEKLYFQTDRTFRKYRQLKANSNVSLCVDNIQKKINLELWQIYHNPSWYFTYFRKFNNCYI